MRRLSQTCLEGFVGGVVVCFCCLCGFALLVYVVHWMARKLLPIRRKIKPSAKLHTAAPSRIAQPCGIRLLRQRPYSTHCKPNGTFGCVGSSAAAGVWVSGGCKGVFELAGKMAGSMVCGFHGLTNRTHSCVLPRPHAPPQFDNLQSAAAVHAPAPPLPACDCQVAGFSYFCSAPRWNDSIACQGGDVGNPDPSCCSTRGGNGDGGDIDDGSGGSGMCPIGWSPCEWRAHARIGWMHAPKTGTSFLLHLAHLASNRTVSALTHIAPMPPSPQCLHLAPMPPSRPNASIAPMPPSRPNASIALLLPCPFATNSLLPRKLRRVAHPTHHTFS